VGGRAGEFRLLRGWLGSRISAVAFSKTLPVLHETPERLLNGVQSTGKKTKFIRSQGIFWDRCHKGIWGDGRTSITSINKMAIQLSLIKLANPRLLLPARCRLIHV